MEILTYMVDMAVLKAHTRHRMKLAEALEVLLFGAVVAGVVQVGNQYLQQLQMSLELVVVEASM